MKKNGCVPVKVEFAAKETPRQEWLFQVLMEFGRSAGVGIRKAADRNGRDVATGYSRQAVDGEVHGAFQLVYVWRAIGRGTVSTSCETSPVCRPNLAGDGGGPI